MDPDTNIFFTQIRSSPWHILAFFWFWIYQSFIYSYDAHRIS